MAKTKQTAYGGQAVMEGVMFAGRTSYVTAIRRKDETIEYFELERKESKLSKTLKKIPFVRGLVALVQASANGTKHLNFSTERYDVDPSEDDQIKKEEETSKLAMILGVGAVGVLSFILGKVLFTLVPTFVAEFFRPVVPGDTGQVLLEGLFKFILLLGYIYFLSLTPLIKRVFQYHGAEHKVINAYENGSDLTVEDVQKHSRLHYRCGSSFLLFTVLVGIVVYLFVDTSPLWWRIVNRMMLIPVVIGLSFEVLQLTNKLRNIPVLRYLGYPGLGLQLLTTKEPQDDQVEVAIQSFKKVLENDRNSELRGIEGNRGIS
ncbi:membrane protein [Pontibacillus halophilus JSM 076056 = DSM 19796]|uniref:Membrane protein n=1 Tax=Pontibacillus halophilus JSM 076056 = DSM 19796 TaxID=1385510 RepID=A0A0A5GFV1_9BACI|nr:DUF1385 domain-containing protein [Pontibacillus halophilus]KGX90894.1 membrane protein [Pontibacillus halophilus JSM 076056 = DSM 19796]